jgi:hypothetical protein
MGLNHTTKRKSPAMGLEGIFESEFDSEPHSLSMEKK